MAIIFATSSTVIRRSAFVASVQSHAPTKTIQSGFPNFWDHNWILIVKGWHFTEYAVLAMLLQRWLSRPLLAFLIAVAFAASDEFHQTFVPDRGGNIVDVTIDVAGALTGLLILLAIQRARSAPEPALG